MKKILIVLIAFLLLSGCSGSGEAKAGLSNEIKLLQTNTIENVVDYRVEYVTTTKKIEPPKKTSVYSYYEVKNSSNVYLDVLLSVKNLTNNELDYDRLNGIFTINGTEYKSSVALISGDNEDVDSYGSIRCLETKKVHFYTEVSKELIDMESTTISFSFQANDSKKYFLNIDLKNNLAAPKKVIKQVDDVVRHNGVSEIEFTSIKFQKKVKPTKPKGFYSYYKASSGNTYLVLRLKYKNVSSEDTDTRKLGSIEVTFLDKYTYTGFCTVDRKGDLDYSVDIDPLKTVKLIYLVEVPSNMTDKPYDVRLFIDDKEYHFLSK